MDRKAFLDQEPPPGYIAGVGRGATGFTTSADKGPVRFESDFGNEVEELEKNDSDAGTLALGANASVEDEEADRIYEEIERRLQKRPKKTEAVASDGKVDIPTGNGVIQQQFVLLKSELATVSVDEWENLPEVGDLTRRNKRQRLLDQQLQRTYAAPDMLIAATSSGFGGAGSTESTSGLPALSQMPESSVKLADIEEWEQKTTALQGDIEKGRLVLSSLRKTNPHRADAWISSARLEEQAKNFTGARRLIMEGCAQVPHSESIWIESIRLHRSEGVKVCKSIMNEALRLNTTSQSLWLHALDLENHSDIVSRRKILMKGLEFLPKNVQLWKELVEIETSDEDKVRLLQKATELCPTDWELLLSLINLSPYSEAKKALNAARKRLPSEPRVWLAALKLEERENPAVTLDKLKTMLAKGMKELEKHDIVKSVDDWLMDAVVAEEEGFSNSARAVVSNSLDILQGDDKMAVLMEYVDQYLQTYLQVANYMLQYVIDCFPTDVSCWSKLFNSLKKSQTNDWSTLFEFHEKSIALNPDEILFYLMFAKDKWVLKNDVPSARQILEDASKRGLSSEQLWVARIKLETRSGEMENAVKISKSALDELSNESARSWYKHIHILRYCLSKKMDLVDESALLAMSSDAITNHPECFKLYLQKSQILIDMDDKMSAREVLSVGTRNCPDSEEVWISLAQLDTDLGAVARARSILDSALLQHPKSGPLWEAKIKLERDQKDMVTARQLVNKSLRIVPQLPGIWMQHLSMIPKMSHRKNVFLDALKLTSNSSRILTGIGFFFWVDGKFQKAKAWFERALNAEPSDGDAYAWNYCFASKHGDKNSVQKLEEQVESRFDDINNGDVWNAVAKNVTNLDKSATEILKLVADRLLLMTSV